MSGLVYSISMSFSLSAIEITTWAQKIIGMVLEVRCRLHYQRKGFYSRGLHFHLLFHSLLSSMLSYFLEPLLFHPPLSGILPTVGYLLKVMLWHFVGDALKVMTPLIVMMFVVGLAYQGNDIVFGFIICFVGEFLQNFDMKNVISINRKDFSWEKWSKFAKFQKKFNSP